VSVVEGINNTSPLTMTVSPMLVRFPAFELPSPASSSAPAHPSSSHWPPPTPPLAWSPSPSGCSHVPVATRRATVSRSSFDSHSESNPSPEASSSTSVAAHAGASHFAWRVDRSIGARNTAGVAMTTAVRGGASAGTPITPPGGMYLVRWVSERASKREVSRRRISLHLWQRRCWQKQQQHYQWRCWQKQQQH
jgi:hypothetical protein